MSEVFILNKKADKLDDDIRNTSLIGVLNDILVQLKIMNIHLTSMTDERINLEDIR